MRGNAVAISAARLASPGLAAAAGQVSPPRDGQPAASTAAWAAAGGSELRPQSVRADPAARAHAPPARCARLAAAVTRRRVHMGSRFRSNEDCESSAWKRYKRAIEISSGFACKMKIVAGIQNTTILEDCQ